MPRNGTIIIRKPLTGPVDVYRHRCANCNHPAPVATCRYCRWTDGAIPVKRLTEGWEVGSDGTVVETTVTTRSAVPRQRTGWLCPSCASHYAVKELTVREVRDCKSIKGW